MFKKELKDLKKQNTKQLLIILREYIITYCKAIYFFENSKQERQVLIKNLIDYFKIIKEENKYFSLILENLDKINFNEIDKILDELDIINILTYNYYNNIIDKYEIAISLNDKKRASVQTRKFKTIIDSSKYQEEILGLLLSRKDVESYFSKYKEILDWLNKKIKIIDCDIQDGMVYYGVFPKMNGNVLIDFNVCVPAIINLKTMLINIHEYKHAIDLFNYLGKEIPPKDYENLAKQEEIKFIKTYIKEKQQKYFK